MIKGHKMGADVTGLYATRNVLLLMGKHEEKGPFGRVKHRLTDSITWTSKFGCEDVG
jgi:hypothetical protein